MACPPSMPMSDGRVPGAVDAHHVVGRERHLQRRRLLRHPLDEADLRQGERRRATVRDALHGDVRRPEHAAHAALPQPRHVRVLPRQRPVGVHDADVALRLFADLPRQVVVPVDEGRRGVDAPGALQQRVVLGGGGVRGGGGRQQRRGGHDHSVVHVVRLQVEGELPRDTARGTPRPCAVPAPRSGPPTPPRPSRGGAPRSCPAPRAWRRTAAASAGGTRSRNSSRRGSDGLPQRQRAAGTRAFLDERRRRSGAPCAPR